MIFLAGTPATVLEYSTSLFTKLEAPIITLSSILIYCKIVALLPINELFPIFTPPDMFTLGLNTLQFPIVTSCPIVQDKLNILNEPSSMFVVNITLAVRILP